MTDTALTTTEAPRPKPPTVTAGGNVGALIPQDIEQAFRIASALAHSKMTPRGFETPEACFVAIMAGAELGLPPFQALQSFAIINNRPTLWGDALVAVIRTNGFTMREWYEGEDDTLTAFCEVTRPDNGDVAEASFSVDDAKTAGLWKKSGPWSTSPKRMLKMRARAFAIRDGAADVLRGFQIREEVEDYGEALPVDTPRGGGTGLLAKLQTTETLATEGFGIRDVSDEAGAAAPAPETPKKRRKKAVDDALNAAGEELASEEDAINAARVAIADGSALAAVAQAEPDAVETTVQDHADAAEDAEFEADAGTHDGDHSGEAADMVVDPENLPADAQVEETGATTPEPAADGAYTQEMTEAFTADQHAIDGPAPADTIYFLAGEEPFPSGRRAVWFNGKPNGSEDAAADFPVYTQHPGEGAVPNSPETAAETPVEPATPEDEVGAEETRAATPLEAFDAAIASATAADELVEAMTALFATDDFKTADQKRIPRQRLWARVAALNDAGAKIDPVKYPYIMGSFVEASSDIEAIEALLVLARDEEWFKAGGEGMQTAVARAVMDRVAVLKGG